MNIETKKATSTDQPVVLITPEMANAFHEAKEALTDGYQSGDRGELERASKSAVTLSEAIVNANKGGQDVQALLKNDPKSASVLADLKELSQALNIDYGSGHIHHGRTTQFLTHSTVSAAVDNMERNLPR
jgi:hypothetical protein